MLKGNAEDFLPSLQIGAHGTITNGSNCFPSVLVSIWDNFHKGQYKKAEELHYSLIPILDLMRRRGDAAIPKAALAMMGHPTGPPRKPLSQATEEDKKEKENLLS